MSKAKEREDDRKFAEDMAGFFHDFFRAAGLTMPAGNSMERVRATGEKMAAAILAASEQKAIASVEALQAQVIDGFVKMETSFALLKDLQTKTAAATLSLLGENKALKERVEELESRAVHKYNPKTGQYESIQSPKE